MICQIMTCPPRATRFLHSSSEFPIVDHYLATNGEDYMLLYVVTVNTGYRHTRYRHSLVIGTKTRVYQLSPAKTYSLQAQKKPHRTAHLVTGTEKTILCL